MSPPPSVSLSSSSSLEESSLALYYSLSTFSKKKRSACFLHTHTQIAALASVRVGPKEEGRKGRRKRDHNIKPGYLPFTRDPLVARRRSQLLCSRWKSHTCCPPPQHQCMNSVVWSNATNQIPLRGPPLVWIKDLSRFLTKVCDDASGRIWPLLSTLSPLSAYLR